MTIEIRHTHAEGTVLEGSTRADAPTIKDAARGRWRWWRDGGCWYVQHSRDRAADLAVIDATAGALRRAGEVVSVSIDNTPRATAEVVADRRERAAGRADRLDDRAERKAAEAAGHRAASDAISDHIPMGQPILVGHHSEARHRRDLARMHSHDEKGWEAAAQARHAAMRADAARQTASGKESRTTVANRIETLRAEIAVDLRALHGYWNRWGQVQTFGEDGRTPTAYPIDPDSPRGLELVQRIAVATEARLFWAEVLAGMGGVSRADVAVGDYVATRFGWARVSRVNAKTVTVPDPMLPRHYTTTVRYADVREVRKKEAMDPRALAALAAE